MKVHTKVGVFETPEVISPRAKYWAGTLENVAQVNQVFGLVQLMLDEAYEAGKQETLNRFFRKWAGPLRGEAIDVEFQVVEEQKLESAGPGGEEAAALSQADGSAEYPMVDGSLPGGSPEVS